MQRTLRLLILWILTFAAVNGIAQSKFNKTAVAGVIQSQLTAMSSASLIQLTAYCLKYDITGVYAVDITVVGKGHVATVFLDSASETRVEKRNRLQHALAEIQFDDIRIPKTERIKIRHTFKF